jgi:site-specific recombinase XerD
MRVPSTAKDGRLDAFHAWVLRRGRSETTADNYRWQVGRCLAAPRVSDRIRDGALSPNSRRLALAALRAWGRFREDGKLLAELDDIRVPPAERVSEKIPLERDDWWNLIDAVASSPALEEHERQALLLICKRGIRAGGVTSLRKDHVTAALRNGILVFESKKRTLRYGIDPIRAELEAIAALPGRWRTLADLLCPRGDESRRPSAARKHLWRLLRQVAGDAGIRPEDIYPHRLRHTYATEFLRQVGGDIEKLRKHMDWKDIKTAAGYAHHAKREELDQVAQQMMQRPNGRKR